MESVDSFRSPPISAEPRWGRNDAMDRSQTNDAYRSRRSPGMQDRRGGPRSGRNRSRSPVLIDRYQPGGRLPRDDYYGQSRDHASRDREDRRRQPSPAGHIDRYVPGENGAMPPPPRVNVLPNPLMMEYQVGFNWFAEWWRVEQSIKEDKERLKDGGRRPLTGIKGERESREDREKERAQIQVAYDAYKEELQAKMARTFVHLHKGEEWFKERYFSEIREPFRQRLMEFRHGALDQWSQDLEAGAFDEFTLEGIYKAESNGAGGVVEREEGETVAAAEVLGVGDLVPSRGGDIRDESALQPALLFKTLAPMVSREKIEALCKEHLGEEQGGFKWLSLSDPNPLKKFHRIGWIMLHPGSDVEPVAERGDGRDEDQEADEGEEGTGEDAKPVTGTAEKALEAINGKTIYDEGRGDFTCHVGVHVPPREPRKKALWDLFSAPERIERDLELAKRLVTYYDSEFGDGADGVSQVEQRVESLRDKGLLQPPATGAVKSNVGKDSDNDMEDDDEGEVDEGTFDDDDEDDEYLLIQKKTLDLLVEYLRRVYNFCFFCVFEADSIHELIRKCPGGHLRRPRASLGTAAKNAAKASALGQPFPLKRKESAANDMESGSPVQEKVPREKFKADQQLLRAFNWVKIFEEKILQILEPDNVDVKKLGGKPVDEGVDEELKKFVKQEDEAKFRCLVPECKKLFKGDSFWRKHVEKRHMEWFDNVKKDLTLVNTYVLDPSHIAPSRSDANSNGHFPMNNHNLNAGTPRGFNLSQMPMMNNFGPGMSPQGMAGQPFFGNMGNHAVTTPNGAWVPGTPMTGMPEGDGMMHTGGPMRRGGGRFNQRQGPYDRRQNSGGGMRYGGGSGRLTPPRNGMPGGRMMMAGGGAGKWGDGAGAQTVGPREAVQGRQLKSYEDLDAVGGSGS
ncbi:MAG: hypothetical protein Q9183_003496, partial [Haloplaca sp. 2 TL-2023]